MGTLRLNPSNGCWIDLFDAPRRQGTPRRLHGPADFTGLRVAESGTGTVESLLVGPSAYVQCYKAGRFEDTVVWFLPHQAVDAMAGLGFEGELDSLRLSDRPPFAFEAGFSAYMLWAAGQVASSQARVSRP